MGWRGTTGCVLVLMLSSTAPAFAQVDDATRAAARTLGSAGVAAYQKNDFKGASDKLERAYQVLQAPSLGLWSARALVKTGKLVEGAQRYLDVTRLSVTTGDPTVQKRAQADARTELAALTPRIPTVIVQLEGADKSAVELKIDGTPLSSALVGESRPINPGSHEITGTRGDERVQTSVTLEDGQQQVALLKFSSASSAAAGAPAASGTSAAGSEAAPLTPPDATASSSGSHTLAWTALGVGAAGVVAGAVTGALVLGKKSSLENKDDCRGSQCLGSESSAVSSYNSLRTVSTVCFVAGGVLAATGVVLFVAGPKHSESASREPSGAQVSLRLGLGSAALGGSF